MVRACDHPYGACAGSSWSIDHAATRSSSRRASGSASPRVGSSSSSAARPLRSTSDIVGWMKCDPGSPGDGGAEQALAQVPGRDDAGRPVIHPRQRPRRLATDLPQQPAGHRGRGRAGGQQPAQVVEVDRAVPGRRRAGGRRRRRGGRPARRPRSPRRAASAARSMASRSPASTTAREVDQRRVDRVRRRPGDVGGAVGRRRRRVVGGDDPGDALAGRPAGRRIDEPQQRRAGHQLERGVEHERVGRIATGHRQVAGGELDEPAVAELVQAPIGPSVDDVVGGRGRGGGRSGRRGSTQRMRTTVRVQVPSKSRGVRARSASNETVGGECDRRSRGRRDPRSVHTGRVSKGASDGHSRRSQGSHQGGRR